MYKCPKCGNFMQWRAPMVYGVNYWICSQCGYSPQTTLTDTTKEYRYEEQKVRSDTGS